MLRLLHHSHADCTMEGDVQLVVFEINGMNQMVKGILEICCGLTWKLICDDGWDDSSAQVACKQLGLSGGEFIDANISIE